MSLLRICVVALAASLLFGCKTTEKTNLMKSAPREVALAQADNNGVLILGLQIEHILQGQLFHTLEFWTVDPDRKLLVHPEQGGKVVRIRRGSWLFGRDSQGDVEYVLQTMPAGTYYLTYVEWKIDGPSATVPKPMAFAFTIKPGVATYIGTFDFRPPFTIFGSMEIRVPARRPADAQALLSQYPNLPQELWDQPPSWFNLACDLGRNFEPPEECLSK